MGLRGPGARKIAYIDRAKLESSEEWRHRKSLVDKVCSFIETLPITSGPLSGTKFVLRSWQKQIIKGIYGPKKNGKRLVRQAIISIPRKNGKTGLTAALVMVHLVGPCAEDRGQIYSAAADQKQAALIYEEIKAMIDRDPKWSQRIIIKDFTKEMHDSVTGTIFRAISAKAGSKHGFNASMVVYDELAQALDHRLYDALSTSMGARKEPLMIVISTQSHDHNHIMSQLVDDGLQIAQGLVEDPSTFAFIKTAAKTADIWDEKVWYDCNPALGDFRSLDEMRAFAAKAKRLPDQEATFRLLYLNQRVATTHRFVPMADWEACGREISVKALEGQPCWGGLDLSGSGKNDLTALVLLFPRENGSKIVLPFFWACESGLGQAEVRDHAPYRLWATQGYLNTTPGKVLDYAFIGEQTKQLANRFDIQRIAFDRYHIENFIQACDHAGIQHLEMEPHGQGFVHMSKSIQALEDEILTWRLIHPNHPILNWCMDNVMVDGDAAGNRKFNKRRASGRIDGAVALAMAAGLSATKIQEKEPQYQVLFV